MNINPTNRPGTFSEPSVPTQQGSLREKLVKKLSTKNSSLPNTVTAQLRKAPQEPKSLKGRCQLPEEPNLKKRKL